MNFRRMPAIGWVALVGIFWGSMFEVVLAQQDKAVVFESVDTQFVGSPTSMGAKLGGRVRNPGNWMAVTFAYQPFPYEGQTYVDELQFKVYIEGREFKDERDREGTTVILPGEATYVNIRGQKGTMGVFLVHPDTVARYGLEQNAKRLNVYVEAYEKGQLVDGIGKNTREEDPEWYKDTRYPRKEGLVYRQDQSPFLLSDVDAFPALKLEQK